MHTHAHISKLILTCSLSLPLSYSMADKQDKSELKAELERKKQRLAQIREEKKRKEEEKNKKKDVSRENRRMM